MIVYLDIYLLENFIVNFFLLYVTVQTIKFNRKLLYISLASLIGSIYAGIVLVYPFKLFLNIPFKLLVAAFMVLISLGKADIILYIKATIILILYSALLGGLCIFIQFSFTSSQYMDGTIINFSHKILMISLMIGYMSINRLVIFIRDRKEIICLTYDVNIKFKNTTETVKAFLDTGNELREPATNLPVMIVEKSIISVDNFKDYEKLYIPYKVINGNVGKLQGFKPDYITIDIAGKKEIREVIVALCDINLDGYDNFQALLSRGII